MWRDQNFANALRSISKQGKVADVLAAATGGRHESFFRHGAIERLITELGEELHTQYVLSFSSHPGLTDVGFRVIKATVQGRPELTVRTRSGYWFTSD